LVLFWKQKPAVIPVKLIPLPPLKGFLRRDVSLKSSLEALTSSEVFAEFVRELEHWPRNSVISAHERAILHWLISEAEAKAVLEIGSGQAGTTLLLASSALQAGRGRVYTIDPYGGERIPPILATWPKTLQEITTFLPKFSTDFFVPSFEAPPFDLILVDGNHSYPNVMHDLFAAYEALRPGGVMVADNAEQIDVLDGARDFARLTPRADFVRLAITGRQESGDYSFSLDMDLEPVETTSAFIIIRKPDVTYITRRALAFHLNQLPATAISKVEATLVNRRERAVRLEGRINLRSLPLSGDGLPVDLGERFGAEIQPGRHTVSFQISGLQLPQGAASGRVFGEANLFVLSEREELELERLAVNDIVVQPGRNFLQSRARALPSQRSVA
jgi:predicted O-methyltransferase YrrM